MSRFQSFDPTTATGKAKDLLTAVKTKLGRDLAMTGVMANSPAVLEGYLSFSGALAGGHLSAKLREQIALITAQENHCNYCLSAHSAIGQMVGLSHEQVPEAEGVEPSSQKNILTNTAFHRVCEMIFSEAAARYQPRSHHPG